ncbi:MAG TPA: transglutaminase family protein [Rhodospirillales bacterium]|jgi:transglutaminase-like putative cysteine protease|nr:transglutaminase family protein [Rhodospirillales bacterium]
MLYDVSHRTTYRYSIPVSFSHHVLHLVPRQCTRQNARRTMLAITPTPTVHASSTDAFGNPLTFITLQERHTELTLHARSAIEVFAPKCPEPAATAPWDGLYDALAQDRSEAGLDALQYTFASPYVPASLDLEAYARTSFTPGRPLLEAALDLTARIFREFAYDATATTVSTPVDEVFAKRRGVCQDFAHLEIACLRSLRLPARYVSGYLLTRPPEGRERLVGADASHAWLSVWVPEYGWVDLDPTNNLLVGEEHITLGWGRDYGDVSLVKGAIFGGGAHKIEVAVDVTPVAAG